MKHNGWFEGTFLDSLKNGQWITEKQVAICKKYMTESRYNAREYKLACANTEYVVHEYQKGYGKFYRNEYKHNVEDAVTDRFGNQYSAL